MNRPTTHFTSVVALALSSTLAAQDAPAGAKPDLSAKNALIAQALKSMSAEPSFAYEVKTKTESQLSRALGAAGGADRVARATWTPQLLHVSFGDDSDEVVFAGRRMIARNKSDAWSIRSGKLANGSDLPHFADPDTMFRVLAAASHKVLHAEVGALEDHPVEIVTTYLEGDAARELLFAGLVPESNNTGAFVFARAVAGAGAAPPKGDLEIDLAFFVDPASKRLLRIRMKAYSKAGGAMGQVVFAGGAVNVRAGVALAPVGGEEEEEEEDAGRDKSKQKAEQPLKFRDGLPVRTKPKKENWTTTTTDITFQDHGAAKSITLDAAALTLLGLPATK